MKKIILYLSLMLFSSIFTLLIFEGIISVSKTYDEHNSLTNDFSRFLYEKYIKTNPEFYFGDRVLSDENEIATLVPNLVRDKLGIGYSPYAELWRTDVRTTYTDENGCLRQKSNLNKVGGYLKTTLFYNFRPMTFWYDYDSALSEESTNFIRKYSFKTIKHTTNETGERITLPNIVVGKKSLIVGDSVALGLMLDDTETLASNLQKSNSNIQYINLGISNATSFDNLCTLIRTLKQYSYNNDIAEVIYIISDNDFEEYNDFIQINDLMDNLNELFLKGDINQITLIYVPYIYNVFPEITRFTNQKNYSFENYPNYHKEQKLMVAQSAEFGWEYINFGNLVKANNSIDNSLLNGLKYYMDDIHLSKQGINLLIDKINK